MTTPIKLVVQLFRITFNRDGGGRLQLDFGNESLEAIQELQKHMATGDVNLAAAFVPYDGVSFELPHLDNVKEKRSAGC